jgi:hypothetical protein
MQWRWNLGTRGSTLIQFLSHLKCQYQRSVSYLLLVWVFQISLQVRFFASGVTFLRSFLFDCRVAHRETYAKHKPPSKSTLAALSSRRRQRADVAGHLVLAASRRKNALLKRGSALALLCPAAGTINNSFIVAGTFAASNNFVDIATR